MSSSRTSPYACWSPTLPCRISTVWNSSVAWVSFAKARRFFPLSSREMHRWRMPLPPCVWARWIFSRSRSKSPSSRPPFAVRSIFPFKSAGRRPCSTILWLSCACSMACAWTANGFFRELPAEMLLGKCCSISPWRRLLAGRFRSRRCVREPGPQPRRHCAVLRRSNRKGSWSGTPTPKIDGGSGFNSPTKAAHPFGKPGGGSPRRFGHSYKDKVIRGQFLCSIVSICEYYLSVCIKYIYPYWMLCR